MRRSRGASPCEHSTVTRYRPAPAASSAAVPIPASRNRWRTAPLDALPWQMSVAAVLLWIVTPLVEPHGHLDIHAKELLRTRERLE